MSNVQTITESLPTLTLRNDESGNDAKGEYRYTHLLPVFPKDEHYPPLVPFEHVDPGFRALSHPNPRAFLDNATSVIDLTPRLGTEVRGVNLVELDNDGRDQLALEVRISASGRPHSHLWRAGPLSLAYADLETTIGRPARSGGLPGPAAVP